MLVEGKQREEQEVVVAATLRSSACATTTQEGAPGLDERLPVTSQQLLATAVPVPSFERVP